MSTDFGNNIVNKSFGALTLKEFHPSIFGFDYNEGYLYFLEISFF